MTLTRWLIFAALSLSIIALAQNADMQLIEADIVPDTAVVKVQSDGGCLLTATSVVQFPSIEPRYQVSQHPFNGTRCATVKNAILTATKKDMRNSGVLVGDGGIP